MRINVSHLSRRLARQLLHVCDQNVRHAQRELHWMLNHVISTTKSQSTKTNLTFHDAQRLTDMVKDRVEHHKPLQYILGSQPFCDLDIVTRPPTLIPRWETEEWVYRLLEHLNQHHGKRRILDLCTGSGCIALALARHLDQGTADIHAVDISSSALSLARLNASLLSSQLANPVKIEKMDVLNTEDFKLGGAPYDLIVSNPPYVTQAEYAELTADVKEWEDHDALVADNDGMAFHLHIANVIGKHNVLSSSQSWPRLVMEIGGTHQVDRLTKALKDNGLLRVEVWKDLASRDRSIAAG
ncbi:S-adenosyl-L-methionine-dependent methyltransferase [Umbelopsis sp. PMI_123]|nr:S-adenosyl-L-methionine-dependent methyltransferase [Umbelopsis sp. PMI_123]